jgi:flagellin-like protein
MSKKGISAVVATVLLILIAVIAVVLIAGFIIPMIKTNLNEGGDCFQLREYVKILDNEYSCYSAQTSRVMIERGLENYTILGIVVSAMTEGNSKKVDITPLPKPGEANTYDLKIANVQVVKIASITKTGKTCDAESYILKPCS